MTAHGVYGVPCRTPHPPRLISKGFLGYKLIARPQTSASSSVSTRLGIKKESNIKQLISPYRLRIIIMSVPFPTLAITKTWHKTSYPAISPTRKELSAVGKTVVITGGVGFSSPAHIHGKLTYFIGFRNWSRSSSCICNRWIY
jgi:hypothetical protein